MQRTQEVNINTGKFGFHKETTNVSTKKRNGGLNSVPPKKRNGKFGCVMGGLSVSESVQMESEQLANEGTSVNEGWKVVSIYNFVFLLVFLACVKYSAIQVFR